MRKKILITGSSGFIGSNFIRYLQKLSRFNDKYTYFSLDKNTDKAFIPTFCVDLADATRLASCLGHFQPDYVVNFASYSDVYYSIRKPWEYMTNNVQLMTNLLNYFKEDKVTRIFHISTDEVYSESSPDCPATTKTLLNPTNPYSASKAAQEMICNAYRNTYGMPITIINLVNNFGPNQDKNKFIPKAIQYIKNEWELPIHCRMEKDVVTEIGCRCWIPVEMTCKVLWNLIQSDYKLEDKIHLGGFTYVNNLDMAGKIAKILNKPCNFDFVDANISRPGHDLKYFLQGNNLFLDNMVKEGYSFDEELEKAVKSYV